MRRRVGRGFRGCIGEGMVPEESQRKEGSVKRRWALGPVTALDAGFPPAAPATDIDAQSHGFGAR